MPWSFFFVKRFLFGLVVLLRCVLLEFWGSRNMKDWFFTCECKRDLDVLYIWNLPKFYIIKAPWRIFRSGNLFGSCKGKRKRLPWCLIFFTGMAFCYAIGKENCVSLDGTHNRNPFEPVSSKLDWYCSWKKSCQEMGLNVSQAPFLKGYPP